MTARLDLVHPWAREHAAPKRVVRFVYARLVDSDWVYGVSPAATETEIENGILNRACEIAECSMTRTATLQKVEARLVDPATAEVLAEYRYDPDQMTFKKTL